MVPVVGQQFARVTHTTSATERQASYRHQQRSCALEERGPAVRRSHAREHGGGVATQQHTRPKKNKPPHRENRFHLLKECCIICPDKSSSDDAYIPIRVAQQREELLLLLLCHASVQPLSPALGSVMYASCSPTWTFGLISGSCAAVGLAAGGSATDDIIIDAPPGVLRLNVLLAARLLLLLLPLGLPTGRTKAPAEEAPQQRAPIIAKADFIVIT